MKNFRGFYQTMVSHFTFLYYYFIQAQLCFFPLSGGKYVKFSGASVWFIKERAGGVFL